MKTECFVLVCFAALATFGQQASRPKITVTPEDVKLGSVVVLSRTTNDLSHNLIFRYVGKTPNEIKAIRDSYCRIQIVKDGVVLIPDAGCAGHGDTNGTLDGLVLLFHTHDEAIYAAKILRGEK